MISRKVSTLAGVESIQAFQAFNMLILGVKMLPGYASIPYGEFLDSIYKSSDAEKEAIIREAVAFGDKTKDEILAFVHFCEDANGIPYGPHNIKSIGMDELFEIIVAVCFEISKIGTSMLVSDDEKKK